MSITITDTGIGFDADIKERLFSRFEQADASITPRYGGTGLGLAITKSLCELMGGSIDVQSTPGNGSTFKIRLPLRRGAVRSDTTAPAVPVIEAPVEENVGVLEDMKVLVVDDHPMNRRIVQIILEPLGFELVMASDGEEAIAEVQRQNFSFILMDMQMPNMDGLSATRWIRNWEAQTGRPRLPIAMLSANAMEEHQIAALEAGCDMHIAKPVTPNGLRCGIEALLSAAEASCDSDGGLVAASS